MKKFLLLFALIFIGCAAAGPNTKPHTNPAANVQWTVMHHYTKKYVCSNLSDEAYFNMIWQKVEDDMVALIKRKKEPAENISLYKQELQEDVIQKRAVYRERYDCLP
jgi:hypothetical protein